MAAKKHVPYSAESMTVLPWPTKEDLEEARTFMQALYEEAMVGGIDMKLDFSEFSYLMVSAGSLAMEAGRIKCLKELGKDELL